MLNAKELVHWDKERLWALPNTNFKVVFDDGVIESHGRAIIFSVYLWAFYRLYPDMPSSVRHHLGNRRIGSSTHMDILNTLFWDCYDAYKAKGIELDREVMMRQMYETDNEFYNDMTYRLEPYVTSIDITDFIEVVEHPVVKTANREIQPNNLSIERTKKKIKDVLLDPKEFIGNPIANNAKNGLTSMTQIIHCVGPRGNLTEIDSKVFPHPVLTGYVHGLRSFEDSAKESRSASKALANAEVPLQTTEYFNRRLQLMAATIKNLHEGDCGSTEYISWLVAPGDLIPLEGKFYLTEQGLKIVRRTDRHLVGESLMLRNVFGCIHPDPQGICSTCYGELALSVPRDSNIGHVAATMLCEQASQNVLSTKHQDDISNIETLQINEFDQGYIQLGSDPNTVRLADRLEKKRVFITLPAKDASRLNDVQYVEDVTKLQLTSISQIPHIKMTVVGRNSEDHVVLPVSIGSRLASMSHELLSYIKDHGVNTTAQGDYQIDLKDWDIENPLLVLPMRHLNMLEYMNVIAAFLRASSTDSKDGKKAYKGRTLRDFETPETALVEFNRIVNSRLRVSISNLEVLIYATMVRSPANLDYALPRVGNAVHFAPFSFLMSRRSLSAAMAYEHHKRVLFDPTTYLIDNRMDHPLDEVMM